MSKGLRSSANYAGITKLPQSFPDWAFVRGFLGYDKADPAQCKPEDKANSAKIRASSPWTGRFSSTAPWHFWSKQRRSERKLIVTTQQLGDYFAKEQGEVKLGILTTGVQWRFFTDLDAENVMDNEPFLEWDVLKDAIPYEFLANLQRESSTPKKSRISQEKRRPKRHGGGVDSALEAFGRVRQIRHSEK